MLNLKERKLDTLYHFYVENGDKLTIEEIAEGIGVTPKTIFNRYHSREEMENELQIYWRQQIINEVNRKMEFCSNQVEKLIFFIDEILTAQKKAPFFFERELHLRRLFGEDPDPAFACAVQNIIDEDKDFAFFSSMVNPEIYSYYFVYVIFNVLSVNRNPQHIDFLLKPALTEAGFEILSDIDVERLLG